MSRRELLRDVLVATCGVTLPVVGITATFWGSRLRTPEVAKAPNSIGRPVWIIKGLVVIKRGVGIRDYPSIPRPPIARLPGERDWSRYNIIEWRDIESVNGVALNGADMFVIENAPMVEGEDPDKRLRHLRIPVYGNWIRLVIKTKSLQEERYYFVSYSDQTREFVQPVGSTGLSTVIEETTEGIVLQSGMFIARADMGKVRTIANPDELNGHVLVSDEPILT